MRLKNKKTGEIGEIILKHLSEYNQLEVITDNKLYVVKTLAELNEEWEDATEEPKEFWYIENDGDIDKETYDGDDYEKRMIKIGNYFSSREEAEKAVEKLKAWKRLKDKGFDFEYVEGYKNLCGNGFEIPITATMPPEAYTDVEVSKDLDLLFCPEENI